MWDTIKQRLRRLTYRQWALVGLVVLLLVSAHWAWNWHCSSMVYRRLAQKYHQNSETVWLVPQWLQHPQWDRAKWYVKRPTGFHLNFRRIDDAVLRDLQSLPTIRSLIIYKEDPFTGHERELSDVPVNASDLNAVVQRIARLSQLESIYFNGPSVTEADLEHLAELRHLKALILGGSMLTELRALPRFQRLKLLYLRCHSITEAGWKRISELTDLEELGLSADENSVDLTHLGASRTLTSLTLFQMTVSSECWAAISQLTALQELEVAQVKFTDPEGRQIPPLPRLRKLSLVASDICDESLTGLGGCPCLTHLYLSQTPITDAAIPHLLRIPNLEELDLRRTNVTKAGYDEFIRVRPNVTVEWQEDRDDDASQTEDVDEP